MVSNTAKYLGIWLDENLSMTRQVNHACSQGYMILRNLWKLSNKLNDVELKKQLVHTCILSKLNFCSSLYCNLPKKELRKLDKLLKSCARFIFNITGVNRWQPMTPFLQRLHFLPMEYRSKFKVNLITYKCFQNQAPDYLKSLLLPRTDSIKNTRKDSDKTWLNQHPLEKLKYKNRAFRFAAPVAWNELSRHVRESPSIGTFKTRLKTFYHQQWLNG